jgi:hypothetical protein
MDYELPRHLNVYESSHHFVNHEYPYYHPVNGL